MSKVMLLDTNISASPIYDELIADGHEVFVIGCNKSDYLAKSAPHFLEADYSIPEKLSQSIDLTGIDFIVPGCNDVSYKSASNINLNNKYYGLDSIENTCIINNKEQFRQLAKEIDLPVPTFFSYEEALNNGPVIIKPVDAYSGRGVTVIKNGSKESLQKAITTAESFSKLNTCIIEEYVTGQLYSHSAFIQDREILKDFIVEEHGTANPFVVDTSRLVYDMPNHLLMLIRNAVNRLVNHLHLVDGLIHTQFITDNIKCWIIEITRRCPGDLYSQLIELSTGFPYASAYIQPFINKKIVLSDQPLLQKHIIRHTISQQCEDLFSSIHFNMPVTIERFYTLALSGDRVKQSPFGRIGLLFINCKSRDELTDTFNTTLQRKLYQLRQS